MGEFLEDILPSLFLLCFVDASRDERDETASPHAGATRDNVGGKSGTDVMYELSGGIETLAAVTEEAGSIGLRVEIEEECSVHDG